MIRAISTAELVGLLSDSDTILVDARPLAAYNGWRLGDEARGGHIPGAVAFPQSWGRLMRPDERRLLLQARGVLPEKRVVVYGEDGSAAEIAVGELLKLGFAKVLAYRTGYKAWAADSARPVARLARLEHLVYPGWLERLLNKRPLQAYAGNPYRLLHVTAGAPQAYQQAHIPGAIHLDTNELEAAPSWNRRSADELLATLTRHGITTDMTVVLYGGGSEPGGEQAHWGQMAAARAAAILMYAGVEDVRLLDGGFDAWLAAGYAPQGGWRDPIPAPSFGAKIPARPEIFVDIDELRRLRQDPRSVLVSVRSWPEYTGETSGYPFIEPAGRIRGAIWGGGGSDAYHMQHYRNLDNTMRQYDQIAAGWRAAGITPDRQIIFYCGTGWRASEAFFYAYLLGWPNVRIYDGGWLEWSADPANPIDKGPP